MLVVGSAWASAWEQDASLRGSKSVPVVASASRSLPVFRLAHGDHACCVLQEILHELWF